MAAAVLEMFYGPIEENQRLIAPIIPIMRGHRGYNICPWLKKGKRIIPIMRGHRGYNICPWLKNGKREICGKSCREEYCRAHWLMIMNGSKIPRPCLGCGIGVRSKIRLCRGCEPGKELFL